MEIPGTGFDPLAVKFRITDGDFNYDWRKVKALSERTPDIFAFLLSVNRVNDN